MTVSVRAHATNDGALRCAWCHDAARATDVACVACGALHHAECWTDAGRCATCSATTTRTAAGTAVDRALPERELPGLVGAAMVALCVFFAVIPFLRLESHPHEPAWAHGLLVLILTVPFGNAACVMAVALVASRLRSVK